MQKPVILLVEDELDLLQVVATALSRVLPGYDVIASQSVGEAEECLDDLEATGTPLALAVVDHMLGGTGGGSGLDLVERIHRAWPEIPTFLFTGQAPPPVEERARRVGTRVLWKPMRLKTLLGEVQGALAN